MTFVLAWIAFPIVMSLLSLGCGLLLETASGMRLPGTLLLPGGFIVIVIATYFAHMTDTTAPLQTPLVVVLAIAGYAVARPWKRFQVDRWLTGSATAVYAVFAAPVVLNGATFAGYIKLDDTATFLSFLNRAVNHGYGAAGLAPSTYKAALLQEGYKYGYPLGSMLPLDVGSSILRVEQIWLWQPYLTFLAVLTGLGLYELVSGLVQSRWLRGCVAFFGAQAALLYGYALWGGVKELFTPGIVLFALCLVPRLKSGTPRQAIALGAASAALLGGLSVGGAIWLLPMLVVGLTLLVVYRPFEDALTAAGVYVVSAGVFAIPILWVSQRRLDSLGKFTKATQIGNLGHPLSWWQVPGIWPSGDFRGTILPSGATSGRPSYPTLTHLLAAVVVLAAICAVVVAWRRRRWEVVVALATAAFACLVYVERGSPWVAGKALASSSPLVLGVGLAGAAVIFETGRRIEGGVVLAVIAGAVLWSNFMQYHAVLVAPSSRLAELETIDHKFSGQGHALLTEYEPYAARSLLRDLDAEATSELRVRQVTLRTGSVASFGSSPDVDQIKLGELLFYRTLIIRRSGTTSRPPSAYSLRWSGRYYDVWQKPAGGTRILEHLSLGKQLQPAAVPACADVMRLAGVAAKHHGVLATVMRPPVTVMQPNGKVGVPTHFGAYGELPGNRRRGGRYKLILRFTVPSAGRYAVWVGGSFSSTLTAWLDGYRIGAQTNQTEWPDNFLYFGSEDLARGKHELVLRNSGPDWRPGSAAQQPFGLGPFVIAQGNDKQGTDEQPVTTVQPSAAHSLCGKSLDWIEALRR